MRIAVAVGWIEADAAQHVGDVVVALGARDEAMHDRCLTDDVGDAQARIERGHRILEDHLDGERGILALPLVKRVHRRAVEADASLAGRHDAGDDASERGLAAARLADQANHFALVDREIDAVDRAHGDLLLACAEDVGDAGGEIERFDEALADSGERDDGGGHVGAPISTLILRSARWARLEGWRQTDTCPPSSFETTSRCSVSSG